MLLGTRTSMPPKNGKGTIEVKSVAYPGIRDTRAFHAVGFPGSDIRSSRENTIHIYPAIVTENLHACHMPAHSEKQIYVIGLMDGANMRNKHGKRTSVSHATVSPRAFTLKVVTNGQTVTRKFIKNDTLPAHLPCLPQPHCSGTAKGFFDTRKARNFCVKRKIVRLRIFHSAENDFACCCKRFYAVCHLRHPYNTIQ